MRGRSDDKEGEMSWHPDNPPATPLKQRHQSYAIEATPSYTPSKKRTKHDTILGDLFPTAPSISNGFEENHVCNSNEQIHTFVNVTSYLEIVAS